MTPEIRPPKTYEHLLDNQKLHTTLALSVCDIKFRDTTVHA